MGTNAIPPAIRAKQRKFTPENIARIKDWLAQGVRRDEIANRLEVSVGSLQVTCSRLGISLRTSSLAQGSGPISLANGSGPVQPIGIVQCYIENIHQDEHTAPPKFWLLIQKQGRQAAFDLPLSYDLITHLGLEASFRGQSIPDLIGKVVTRVMENRVK